MSHPFLLLTPLGRLDPRVASTFRGHGVTPLEVIRIPDYPTASTELYARKPLSAERAKMHRAYEDIWRKRVSDVSAELWRLDDTSFERAWTLKPQLRIAWPPEDIPFEKHVIHLRSFHLPDPPDVPKEWAWLISQRSTRQSDRSDP